MARLILSRLLLAVGLLAASLAWAGFTLQRTVFDPSRSERVAAALLDDDQLQRTLVERTTASLLDALPPSTAAEVSRAELERTARRALSSPEAAAALRATLVDTHRYLVGEASEAPELSSASLDEALRAQLVAVDPELFEVVPQLPTITIELPDAGLSAIRAVRDGVDELTDLTALAALGGVAGALVVARDRARILRRVGWWAMTAAGLWLVLGWGLPVLAQALVPESATVVGALADVVAGGMVTPAVVVGAAGLATVVATAVHLAGPARSVGSARSVGPARSAGPPAPTTEPAPPTAWAPTAPASAAPGSAGRSPAPVTEPLPSASPRPPAGTGSAPGRPVADAGPWGFAWQPEKPPAAGARWVEGVGYVEPAGESEPVGGAEPAGGAGGGGQGTPGTPTPRT